MQPYSMHAISFFLRQLSLLSQFSICDGDIQTVNTNRLVSWKGGSSYSHFLNMLYDILHHSIIILFHT